MIIYHARDQLRDDLAARWLGLLGPRLSDPGFPVAEVAAWTAAVATWQQHAYRFWRLVSSLVTVAPRVATPPLKEVQALRAPKEAEEVAGRSWFRAVRRLEWRAGWRMARRWVVAGPVARLVGGSQACGGRRRASRVAPRHRASSASLHPVPSRLRAACPPVSPMMAHPCPRKRGGAGKGAVEKSLRCGSC